MNIPAFQSAARAAGNAVGTNPQSAQPRQQAAPPAPASNIPRDAARQPPEARPVLDLSDTALTRRDIPRGSIVDIVA
jgi:hypothetical protein